jgi:hypothetical protein
MPTTDPEYAPRRSPILVALAGWLLPGSGYWLIGERARGLVVGITIIILFTAGTLIGGVRAIQVPGFGEDGGYLYTWHDVVPDPQQPDRDIRSGHFTISETPPKPQPGPQPGQVRFRKYAPRDGELVVTHFKSLLSEIGNKPWSICQVLAGPIAIAGGATSVWASRPTEPDNLATAPGALSHSRINEIAVLYTAVAGMLNLLVIIDAAARASRGVGGGAAGAPA